MQKRNVLNSPRLLELKKSRKKAVWGKIFISLFGLATIFALLVYISRLNNLNIKEIQIEGNKTIDGDTLKAATQEEMSGKYLWLFPKTNALIYPKNDIKNKLEENFKRLKDIKLSIKDNRTLTISLNEREAKYLWCGDVILPLSSTENKCYFLDEEGYLFDEAPYFSGDVYFRFYGTITGEEENLLGSYFMPENFSKIISLKETLKSMGLKISYFSKNNNNSITFYLSPGANASENPLIVIDTDSDFQNVAENLDAALNTEPLKSKMKNKYSLLRYIDLRFGNKVYFKFNE